MSSVISLTTKKGYDKIFVCKFSNNVMFKLYHIENSRLEGNNEPPHQNLHCLQIHLFSSLVVKEFIKSETGIYFLKILMSDDLFVFSNKK